MVHFVWFYKPGFMRCAHLMPGCATAPAINNELAAMRAIKAERQLAFIAQLQFSAFLNSIEQNFYLEL